MALDGLLGIVNGLGGAVSQGFTTFITLNHRVGDVAVGILGWALSQVTWLVTTVWLAVHILLEDLWIFLSEALDSVKQGGDLISTLFESLADNVVRSGQGIGHGISWLARTAAQLGTDVAQSISDVREATVQGANLLGASVVLLVGLVPRTLYFLYRGLINSALSVYGFGLHVCQSVVVVCKSAPLEMLVGLISGVAIAYLVFRVSQKLIRDYAITPALILETGLQITFCVYLNFVRGLLALILGLAQGVAVVLSHMHVPQFHHAGDSDEYEEEEPGPVHVDDSEPEDQERQVRKRRNYDLLLLRRERRRERENHPGSDEDVEDLLFEQVEREREDKLCVICQDEERCIMILPCRHLCICQGCQEPLLRAQNKSCPICRKMVRQTIKAYL